MNMNAGIILQGQTPDIAGSVARGQQNAMRANQIQQQNRLAQAYQQHGAGAIQGNQNALAALAGVNPELAGQFQQQGIQNQNAEREMQMREKQFAFQVQKQAAGMSAQQRAAEAEQIKRGVLMASGAQTPEQWDQVVASIGQQDLVGKFDQKDMLLRQYMTAAQILAADAPSEPADEYGRYVLESKAKGEEPLDRIQYAQAKKGKGFSVTTTDGTVVQYGGPATDSKISPSSPEAMINSIDGILDDPALDWATGPLAFAQNIPGTGAKRFGARAKQLEGQAFLQAFESLKGAGQITEIEGAKATQAIGRLDTAQSPKDYRDALTELKGLLEGARSRPEGWAAGRQTVDFSGMTVEDFGSADIDSMSEAELKAYMARGKELGF